MEYRKMAVVAIDGPCDLDRCCIVHSPVFGFGGRCMAFRNMFDLYMAGVESCKLVRAVKRTAELSGYRQYIRA
jgi:hypothetical protein